LEFFLLRKLIIKNVEAQDSNTKVEKVKKGEQLKFNVGSTEVQGEVEKMIEEKDADGKV
jgi:translation initiation factor 2 gamma subunit (eIF-2gamma)